MIAKTALILEGGGSRGMFSAGILEILLKYNIYFESVYGVSAGAYNAASYLSNQPGRNLAINDYIGDKRYRGVGSLLRTGSLFNWDFIFDKLANDILPFDYKALHASSSKFYVGISNCITAKAEFVAINGLSKAEIKTLMIATGSLPLIAPIEYIKEQPYLDGGLADSIPFEYALGHGSERAIVILTQPKGYEKKPLKFKGLFKMIYRKQPKVYEMLAQRATQYNTSLKQLEKLEESGQVFVIRPEQKLEVGRIEGNPEKTVKVYHEAMTYAEELLPKLQVWLDLK